MLSLAWGGWVSPRDIGDSLGIFLVLGVSFMNFMSEAPGA